MAATPSGTPRTIPPQIEQTGLHINVGGGTYTDTAGTVWSADQYFTGGWTSTTPFAVTSTVDAPLYVDQRVGTFAYTIPAAAGAYTVNLLFADPKYAAAGKRYFNVRAEGALVLGNFDAAKAAGGQNALVKTVQVNVVDGALNLKFDRGSADFPILSGIEVLPRTSPDPQVGAITSLTLIDAKTDQPVGPVTSEMLIDLTTGKQVNLRADVAGIVKSVQFLVDGAIAAVENVVPFCIAGDSNGDFNAWSIASGTHTIIVIPYSLPNAGGFAGSAYTMTVTVQGPTTQPTAPDTFTQLSWANRAKATLGRAEALTGAWGTRLYIFGGFSDKLGPVTDASYYDTAADKWTNVRPLPERITHAGQAYDSENAYFVAGYVGTGHGYDQIFGSKHAWVYNYASDTYTALPDLPSQLAGGGAAIVGRELHYFGGYVLKNRADTNIHLVLNLDNLAAGWQNAPIMLHTRSHMGAVVFNGKIYAIAGQTGYDDNLKCQNFVEIYDPVTKVWTSGKALPAVVSHTASATFVMGDRIIVAGGELAHEKAVRLVWAYTPATDSWVALTSLPDVRFSGVARSFGEKIYFTTGGNQTTTWVGTPVVPVSGKPK